MEKQYIFFADPGHAWLRVPKKEIAPIKDKISSYSYMNGKYVYLEEDCDAGVFLLHKFGSFEKAKPFITEKHSEKTAIRNFAPFSPSHC